MTKPKPARMFAAIKNNRIVGAIFPLKRHARWEQEDEYRIFNGIVGLSDREAWLRARKAGVRIVRVVVTVEDGRLK
jgi:hypothetical protein